MTLETSSASSLSSWTDAFAHHSWATLRLIDVLGPLSAGQLATSVPGTFGSIIDTLRHTVEADCSYLSVIGGGKRPFVDAEAMGLDDLRREVNLNASGWQELVGHNLDPRAVVVRHRPDGSETYAPVGIRLAQALHHGSDHRSQICTALTTLGVEPPAIDVWDYGVERGSVTEVAAPAAH